MKRIIFILAALIFCMSLHAQSIQLLYKNNLGWNNPLSWLQINTPTGQTPIQRVPTVVDDVIISAAMSGLSAVSFSTTETNNDFNIGGSSVNGPALCRSMHIRNTSFSILPFSTAVPAADINVYTANGGFLKIDSTTNFTDGKIILHGGDPAITDLQLLNSNYGVLFRITDRTNIFWKSGARLRMVGSSMGGYNFSGDVGADVYIENSTIETTKFYVADNSTLTLLNTSIINNTNVNYLKFFIGKNTNFTSANNTVSTYNKLEFTTSGTQFNGNVAQLQNNGLIDFLQEDPANPLPNIINGNFSASELTNSLGISGDLKISGNFSGFSDDIFNNPIPVVVNNQTIFNMGGIKNYGSAAYINNCVQDFCHFKLEFFGNTNSHINWFGGGFPVDTLIINKTNCAKVTVENSLYVSGATNILGGQLVLNPNENISYKWVNAGNLNIAAGAGLFLRRDAAGVPANIAIAGTLTNLNPTADSLCTGLSNPYNGTITFYRTGALPLSLIDFAGSYFNKTINLKWLTETEENVSHYILEKSINQLNFMPIGSIGATNGTGRNNYDYTDNNLIERINYYRLKMVDMDGSFTYSKIVAVAAPEQFSINIYPNPFSEELMISLPENPSATAIIIRDAKGSLVKRVYLKTGTSATSISTSDLPAGVYSVSVTGHKVKYSKLFIKK